jgi:hypothetical protein
MPQRRQGTANYQVNRVLPGYGRSGLITCKTKRKRTADAMERALIELAEKALIDDQWRALLDAIVRDHAVDLPTLLQHTNSGKLEVLLRTLTDPLLKDVVASGKERWADMRENVIGLDYLLEVAPKGAKLSAICSGKVITELCHKLEKKRSMKRNSVRRYMLQAVSKLLTHELGKAERNRIFADVRYSEEDDSREVHLTPEEITRLIDASINLGYEEMALIIRVALVTSADRGVLVAGERYHGEVARGLLVKDLKKGALYLDDTKTKYRQRTVPISATLAAMLRAKVDGKKPDEPVFDLKYRQMDYQWKHIRQAAGLSHLRFKDLRKATGQYGESVGIAQTKIVASYGHGDTAMTRQYQKHRAVMSADEVEAIEAAMGFGDATA